jgi:hypothetical protein
MALQMTGIGRRLVGLTESAYAQIPGSPAGLVLPIVTSQLKAAQSRDKDQTLSGFRGMPRGMLANQNIAGTVTVNSAPGSIGWWLKHLIGVPTTTGASAPYTHTFQAAMPGQSGALPAGFIVEDDQGANYTSAMRYIRYQGCRINQGKFSLKPSGFLEASFDIIGSTFSRASSLLDATPTDNGQNAFPGMSGSLVLTSGGAIAVDITQFDLNWSNDLDNSSFVIGGGGTLGSLPEGNADATGSVTFLLKDDAMQAKVLSDSDFSITASVKLGDGTGSSAGNEKLTFNIPASAFEINTPTIPGPKGISVQANFSAHRTTGELGVTAVLLSPLASVEGD